MQFCPRAGDFRPLGAILCLGVRVTASLVEALASGRRRGDISQFTTGFSGGRADGSRRLAATSVDRRRPSSRPSLTRGYSESRHLPVLHAGKETRPRRIGLPHRLDGAESLQSTATKSSIEGAVIVTRVGSERYSQQLLQLKQTIAIIRALTDVVSECSLKTKKNGSYTAAMMAGGGNVFATLREFCCGRGRHSVAWRLFRRLASGWGNRIVDLQILPDVRRRRGRARPRL